MSEPRSAPTVGQVVLGRRLLDLRPAVIRGNASEIIALAGGQSASKGVDARDPVRQAEQAARELARARATVVAVTGEVDFVTDGQREVFQTLQANAGEAPPEEPAVKRPSPFAVLEQLKHKD